MSKTCGGHTGDSFSSQEQAGVCGGAGTQLPAVGAARQPCTALAPWPEAPVLQFGSAFLCMCGGQYSAFCFAAASCTAEQHYWLSQVSVLFSVEERLWFSQCVLTGCISRLSDPVSLHEACLPKVQST